jgi:hypothetical protein
MAERNSGCELIQANRVNLLNIVLYDLHANKSYKAKCVCGFMFNIDIYISGLFLEEQKKTISQYVTKKMVVTIFQELLIRRWGYILINTPRLLLCRGRVQSVPIR